MTSSLDGLTTIYNRQKDALMKEKTPFISYLHYDTWRETGGYQIIKLIEVREQPLTVIPDKRLHNPRASNWLTKRGRRNFDSIVRKLEKAGALIDVTEYMPEDGDT